MPLDLNKCSSVREIKVGQKIRHYAVMVPDSLCRESPKQMVTVPLILSIHCFGCQVQNIINIFSKASYNFRFVVAAPEGYGLSFNAGVCCGPALKEGLDDMALVRGILKKLMGSRVAPGVHLSSEAVYSFGFSNGGYMSSMVGMLPEVRGFVALAGHTYDLPHNMTPRTVSLHWRKSDTMVRYNGCCADQLDNPPACCCGISALWKGPCIGVDNIFKYWVNINQCSGTSVTVLRDGVECHIGKNCKRPTQLCSYASGEHSSWSQHFTEEENVGEFIAKDARSLISHSPLESPPSSNQQKTSVVPDVMSSGSNNVLMGSLGCIILVIGVVALLAVVFWRRQAKVKPRETLEKGYTFGSELSNRSGEECPE